MEQLSEQRNHYEYRRIYIDYFGPIPKGYHIHHKDGNCLNNSPENLECLSPQEHAQRHPHMQNFISESHSACVKGGRVQGRINVKSGHWDKISSLGRSSNARKKAQKTMRNRQSGFFNQKARQRSSQTGTILKDEKRGIFSEASRDKVKKLLDTKDIGFGSFSDEQRSKFSTDMWNELRNKNPEEYQKRVQKLKRLAETARALRWEVTNPNGETLQITNLSAFCKENNLSVGTLRMTSTGDRKHHKGWKAKAL